MAEAIVTQRQLLRASAGTLQATFYNDDGVPADPGSTTVSVSDAAGTTIIASGAAGGSSTTRTVAYTGTHTALLNRWTITWATTNLGTLTTTLEVVGAFLFSVAEARQWDDAALANTTSYPTAVIEAKRASVLDRFCEILGYSPVPRYVYLADARALSGDGLTSLRLPDYDVTSIRSVAERSYGGTTWTAFTADQLADIYLTSGTLYREALGTWLSGRDNYRVGYEHGRDSVPGPLREAALIVARDELVPSSVSLRALDQSAEFGTIRMSLPDPSRGRWYGIPRVDAILNDYAARVPVVG